jgi:hypothetical protein
MNLRNVCFVCVFHLGIMIGMIKNLAICPRDPTGAPVSYSGWPSVVKGMFIRFVSFHHLRSWWAQKVLPLSIWDLQSTSDFCHLLLPSTPKCVRVDVLHINLSSLEQPLLSLLFYIQLGCEECLGCGRPGSPELSKRDTAIQFTLGNHLAGVPIA